MKIQYSGHRDADDAYVVRSEITDDGEMSVHVALDVSPSLKLRNHSPTGFEWGYGGSGPAQLALAILLDATGDAEISQAFYQQYKFDVIANLNRIQPWKITADSVREWVRQETARQLAAEDKAAAHSVSEAAATASGGAH